MRFKRCIYHYKQPDLSEKRLKLVARYIEQSRQKMGLFADFTEMPTTEQRIREQTDSYNKWVKEYRQHQAAEWRRARKIVYSLPPEQRNEVLEAWNNSKRPAEPAYLLDYLMEIGIIERTEITTPSMNYAFER